MASGARCTIAGLVGATQHNGVEGTFGEQGARCTIAGLVGATQHNGMRGTFGSFDAESERWNVHLDSGAVLGVKSKNLLPSSAAEDKATDVQVVAALFGENVPADHDGGSDEFNPETESKDDTEEGDFPSARHRCPRNLSHKHHLGERSLAT
ncbi:hypothetical protein T484DRAFT_1790015 [Baffinella frigidus]|nr:hypothetical protein T484DRAFT_1790015 [Cryptophyta sp. CCMP2293]